MAEKNKCQPLGLQASFGFGDRIGLATPGHVAAMKREGNGIAPIFPQQSIREMTRTHRTATDVMQDALKGAESAGWDGVMGADADHLKTEEDVKTTASAGFSFFTIDPSDDVDQQADDYDEPTLRSKLAKVRDAVPWLESYIGKTITLSNDTMIELSELSCLKAAVKYGVAIKQALELGKVIKEVNQSLDQDYEIELSVDETDQPTTLAEHFIIADQCLRGGMKLVSLAPRFIGELEKGVDYKGNVAALEQSLADHAAIAQMLGPYKLSLHSGSDKLSMYKALASATEGRFHVKTAGTSYVEALRVVARHDEDLFRRIIRFARSRYDTDKATYHVSATNEDVPDEAGLNASEIERVYLERWADVPEGVGFVEPGRQILHCTFGSTLTDPDLGPAIRKVLENNQQSYTEILDDHFSRHLRALKAGM